MTSLFVRARDAYETYSLGVGGTLYNAGTERHQEADARYAMQDQMKAYKDLTEISKKELQSKQGELNAEKRRVEEKQIRALRGQYRPAGFMNNQAIGAGSADAGTTNKLGG